MKGKITLYFLLVAFSASSKGWGDWRNTDLKKFINEVSISSDYYYDSDAVTNEIALEYFNKGFITDEMKDRVTPKLSDLNRLGAESINEISYVRYPDSLFSMKNCFFSVSINNRIHINSSFSRDAFELYFRGNKDFAGKNAQVSDFIFQDLVYQQINFTFGHRFKRSDNWFGYSAGVSLNKGQKHYLVEAEKATIYTEPNGEYIDLDLNGELFRSDSSADNLMSTHGAGVSGDFSFFWQSKNKNTLTLTAENFGFITWNSQSTYVKADTLFHFEGVDVSYLFDLEDTIRKTISLDSSLVEPYLTERTKKSYTKPLPALLKANYQFVLTEGKTNLEAEAGYLFFATSLPYGSVKLNYSLHNQHQFGLKVRYGGYGTFNAGLSYKLLFLKRWMFSVESDYLSSMFNPKNNCGYGASASLSAYF